MKWTPVGIFIFFFSLNLTSVHMFLLNPDIYFNMLVPLLGQWLSENVKGLQHTQTRQLVSPVVYDWNRDL